MSEQILGRHRLPVWLWQQETMPPPAFPALAPAPAPFHLHQKLLIGECEDVGDGSRLIVQAEAREQQQQGRGRGTSLFSRAVTEALGRLAHGADETHDEALTDSLAAELAL